MKRDLELLRKIVYAVEARADDDPMLPITIAGYTERAIQYHSYLAVDAGLAQGIDISSSTDNLPQYLIENLTSKGHDFADAARNDTIWKKVTNSAREKAVTVTIDVVLELLKQTSKRMIGVDLPV